MIRRVAFSVYFCVGLSTAAAGAAKEGAPPGVEIVAIATVDDCPSEADLAQMTMEQFELVAYDGNTDTLELIGRSRIFQDNVGSINAPAVGTKQRVLIAFFNAEGKTIKSADAGFRVARLYVGDLAEPSIAVERSSPSQGDYSRRACVPLGARRGEPLKAVQRVPNGQTLRLSVEFGKNGEDYIRTVFIERENEWQAYALDPLQLDAFGFWFPVGLFGSNLKKTEEGIQFSAVPIGLAVGGKRAVTADFYVGTSLALTWSISHTAESVMDSAGMVRDVPITNVKTYGVGGLIDLGGWAYVGGHWVFDGSSRRKNPGFFALVGAGSELLSWLAGSR